ncbi:MAG: hypothetical protein AAGK74_06170, partial [Chloroflexota bacterium]
AFIYRHMNDAEAFERYAAGYTDDPKQAWQLAVEDPERYAIEGDVIDFEISVYTEEAQDGFLRRDLPRVTAGKFYASYYFRRDMRIHFRMGRVYRAGQEIRPEAILQNPLGLSGDTPLIVERVYWTQTESAPRYDLRHGSIVLRGVHVGIEVDSVEDYPFADDTGNNGV